MTGRQENKITSYLGVNSILKRPENMAVWNTDTAFSGLVTWFQGTLTELLAIQKIQETDNSGVTMRKGDVRTSLEDAVMRVVKAAVAHALIINDLDLLAAVDYKKSDVKDARDSALLGIASVVYDSAWPIRVALAARHITEAEISRVSTLRDQFIELIPEPRTGLIISMTATLDLKNKMKEMDTHLRRMDQIILMFEEANPTLIEHYNRGREIIDLGVRHTGKQAGRISGTVLQAGTLIPLQNASVVVVGTKRRTKTDADGKFGLIFHTKSVRIVRVTLENHEIYTSNSLQITPGEEIKLNIQLQPGS